MKRQMGRRQTHPQQRFVAVAMGIAGLALARPERGMAGLRPLAGGGESRCEGGRAGAT